MNPKFQKQILKMSLVDKKLYTCSSESPGTSLWAGQGCALMFRAINNSDQTQVSLTPDRSPRTCGAACMAAYLIGWLVGVSGARGTVPGGGALRTASPK